MASDIDVRRRLRFKFELGLLPDFGPLLTWADVDRHQISVDESARWGPDQFLAPVWQAQQEATEFDITPLMMTERRRPGDEGEKGRVVLLPINKVKNGV